MKKLMNFYTGLSNTYKLSILGVIVFAIMFPIVTGNILLGVLVTVVFGGLGLGLVWLIRQIPDWLALTMIIGFVTFMIYAISQI